MFKNYIKTAFRAMLKNGAYSLLNIFGLAVGIACAALILLWVEDEVTFDHQFEKMRHHYKGALEWCLNNPALTLILFFGFVLLSLPVSLFIGEDFFPYVDSGQMRLHINPPEGLRLEDSEQYFAALTRSPTRTGSPRRKRRSC